MSFILAIIMAALFIAGLILSVVTKLFGFFIIGAIVILIIYIVGQKKP